MSDARRGRVAMLVAPREIALREEAVPQPEPGGIVVRVRTALTDGTDLKTYRRGHPKMPMPTRFGHEFSGDVVAAGPQVTRFRAGDAVMCAHTAPCGTCYWCERGQEELCDSIMPAMLLGAYADYIAVPERILARNCFHKPEGIGYREAAFLEPIACVMHSLERIDAGPEAVVAILGNGGFGILHALLLRGAAASVLLCGRRAERNELARELGLTVIDTRTSDLRSSLLERTGGRGADVVVECTGSQTMWEEAPLLARRGGLVSFFGGLPASARVTFEAARLHYDGVRLVSPFHFTPRSVRAAYEAIVSGRLAPALAALVSHAYRLDAIASAFEMLDRGEGLKVAIEP
jgi:L-iditol 2-dehydrogenase